jgi:hypothetical protein
MTEILDISYILYHITQENDENQVGFGQNLVQKRLGRRFTQMNAEKMKIRVAHP